jgi:hypothetical protein
MWRTKFDFRYHQSILKQKSRKNGDTEKEYAADKVFKPKE